MSLKPKCQNFDNFQLVHPVEKYISVFVKFSKSSVTKNQYSMWKCYLIKMFAYNIRRCITFFRTFISWNILLFLGSLNKSFNSKCSKRFETKDLEEDAVHYYYYRSLPRLSTMNEYTPSITSSVENVEPPKLPKVLRKADLLL